MLRSKELSNVCKASVDYLHLWMETLSKWVRVLNFKHYIINHKYFYKDHIASFRTNKCDGVNYELSISKNRGIYQKTKLMTIFL